MFLAVLLLLLLLLLPPSTPDIIAGFSTPIQAFAQKRHRRGHLGRVSPNRGCPRRAEQKLRYAKKGDRQAGHCSQASDTGGTLL